MKRQTIFNFEAAIAMVAAGNTGAALSALENVYHEITKEDYPWKLTEKPAPGTRVSILYSLSGQNDYLAHIYDGIWDGEKFLMRKPYTIGNEPDNFEYREEVKILGWDVLNREPYQTRD